MYFFTFILTSFLKDFSFWWWAALQRKEKKNQNCRGFKGCQKALHQLWCRSSGWNLDSSGVLWHFLQVNFFLQNKYAWLSVYHMTMFSSKFNVLTQYDFRLMDHIGIMPSELGRDSAIERVKAYKKNHSEYTKLMGTALTCRTIRKYRYMYLWILCLFQQVCKN